MNIDQVKLGIKAHWADTPSLERLPPQERNLPTYQTFSEFLKHKADAHLLLRSLF
jgi:hypothetical protein